MNVRLIFVHAFSPLHAGTGQGIGVIDLPIAREKATGLPFLPGSSLKGALRDGCADDDQRRMVFGPDTTNADEHAGSAQFSDLRLLLLPVRSLAGTFAWVTSPYILHRFLRDVRDAGVEGDPATVPQPSSIELCLVANQGSALRLRLGPDRPLVVALEDLDLEGREDANVTAFATWIGRYVFPAAPDWQQMMSARFCVVHDDVLSFLLETASEVTARVKLLEESKTVKKGGLWYEESLPAETILAGMVLATPVTRTHATADQIWTIVTNLTSAPLQLGGKATVGRGLCRVRLA